MSNFAKKKVRRGAKPPSGPPPRSRPNACSRIHIIAYKNMSIRQYAYQKLFEEILLIQFSLNLKIENFLCKDSFFKVMVYQIL